MQTEGRKLLSAAITWLLPVVLFAFIFTTGFTLIINDTPRVKQMVSDSGLYTTIMDAVVAQAVKTNSGTPIAAIPVEQSDIQTIIHQAFPTSTIALQGNQAIDGLYAWLRGQTDLPVISIDLSEGKQQLAAGLATYVQQRLPTLPICPDAASAATFNPYTGACLPPGLSVNDVAQATKQQVAESTNFLAQPVIHTNSLTNKQGQPLIESSSRIPQAYQRILGLPVLMGSMAVILIILSLLVAQDRHRQYGKLSFLIVGVGITAIAISFVVGKAWQHFGSTLLESTVNDNQILLKQQSISIINSMSDALTRENILLSLIVIAAGFVLFVMGRTASHSGIPLGRMLKPAPSPDAQKIPLVPPKD